jgi:hypothetical protein
MISVLPVTGPLRQVVLRRMTSLYHVNPTVLAERNLFPRMIMPPYMRIESGYLGMKPITSALTLKRQFYYTWIILHTTYLGEYTTVEETGGQSRRETFERLY